MCKKVQDLVYSDRRIQVEEIAQALGSALLKRFSSKDDFLLRLVTVDETWVHYYEPENKAQSRQWVYRAWVPEAKEVQDATICWQGDGHSILGRKRRYYVGHFIQEKYNNWSVLC